MAEFDDDGATRLKQWWEQNGTALVIGVALGVAVIIAWQGWRWYGERQASAAAEIYAQIEQPLAQGEIDDGVVETANRLKDDYAGTPYAASAALRLGAYYVAQQDYAKAREQLDWAMNNADNDGIRQIARVRAARLAWAQDKPDEALSLLEADHPQSFESLYAEVEGDIHAAQGDREAAYAAYQRALENLPENAPRSALEDKLADNAPSDSDTGTPSEQESASAS